jgi:hypothetical protein
VVCILYHRLEQFCYDVGFFFGSVKVWFYYDQDVAQFLAYLYDWILVHGQQMLAKQLSKHHEGHHANHVPAKVNVGSAMSEILTVCELFYHKVYDLFSIWDVVLVLKNFGNAFRSNIPNVGIAFDC